MNTPAQWRQSVMLVGDHHQGWQRDYYHHQDNGGGELDGTGIGNGDDDPSIPALTSIRTAVTTILPSPPALGWHHWRPQHNAGDNNLGNWLSPSMSVAINNNNK